MTTPVPDHKPTVTSVHADLIAEQNSLDNVVADLDDHAWELPTPSVGWSVADQIGHLAYFDHAAALAITDPDAFHQAVSDLMAAAAEPGINPDDITLNEARSLSAVDLLAHWRSNRARLADASASLSDTDRVVWYGPSMGARSFLTARLMECWAHGQDIIDALDLAGIEHPALEPSDRIIHVAQLGYITRAWSYINRGQEVPDQPVRVELTTPTAATITFGPDDAAASVVGSAVDFCLVTTQRRHVDDTNLTVTGDAAIDWMGVAQIFAGPPSTGPARQ